MAKKILTPLQNKFLALFSRNKALSGQFYLTGGTALAGYYLYHRLSEDLDFFTKNDFNILGIDVFLKQIKKELRIKKIDYQRSFNRNIFFLHMPKEILKVEFTYFPFDTIQRPLLKDGVYVDSLIDIAANKVFTVSQSPRARDFIDLYFIMERYKELGFERLLKLAREKFDWQIDPLNLGAQLLKAKNIADLPRMVLKIEHKQWRNFFLARAKGLSRQIFT